MSETRKDLIKYRIQRSRETLHDARLLADNQRWNSAINRLYYAAYYAVMALLIDSDLKPTTHNGAKSNFSMHFVKTGKISKELGKAYSQLFTWRQKGDYDDLFYFDLEKVEPYFAPVGELIESIEKILNLK